MINPPLKLIVMIDHILRLIIMMLPKLHEIKETSERTPRHEARKRDKLDDKSRTMNVRRSKGRRREQAPGWCFASGLPRQETINLPGEIEKQEIVLGVRRAVQNLLHFQRLHHWRTINPPAEPNANDRWRQETKLSMKRRR